MKGDKTRKCVEKKGVITEMERYAEVPRADVLQENKIGIQSFFHFKLS